MDSQDSSAAPSHHPQSFHHLQQHHHHHHQPPPPSSILVSQHQPNSYPLQSNPTANSNSIMQQQQQNPPRFPFNSSMVSSSGPGPGPKPFSDYVDGGGQSSPTTGGGTGPGGGFNIEPAKKKRGRPRKYSPDGAGSSIALGLSPTPVTPISSASIVGLADSGGGGGGGTLSSETPAKKHRGRPPGSGKRQLDALGAAGVGFTPHVITVKAGEDIASKIMAFSQQGPRTVCILSANGAICNVTLRQPAMSGGTVTYEGRFEIISLSGSFLLSENNGSRSRTGGLSVSLAGSDGRVLGGGVAGMLMAATPVQVVVGSFIADGKKPKGSTVAPAPGMLSFGNPVIGASPPSQGASSDSSDDNGSPLNRSSGPYNNAQTIQNIPMYTNMGWPNSTVKMHPN
ncbi:AT-hook motif nuclear-localized protein 10-like [Coffea eugenioides]|uniref:AT-hook motif nuclear-localized protein 10-like n=1 Tax=Coffea eugenioides TaxID=49369 RepID=UPI000F615C18|nr:AT-hook motif nuclear-localized protein 10-like [Coffea eugenioides]